MRGVDAMTEIDASREPINAAAAKIPDDKWVHADAGSAVNLVEIGVEIIEESSSPLDPCEVILVGNADARGGAAVHRRGKSRGLLLRQSLSPASRRCASPCRARSRAAGFHIDHW